MASLFLKLIRKQSPTTLITNYNKRILAPSSSIPPHLSHTNSYLSASPIPLVFGGVTKTADESRHSASLKFYPSFSFGGLLNPISETGFVQSAVLEQGIVSSDDDMIWADSVKKKRKKKMNKHKLKKLKKRLRRKT